MAVDMSLLTTLVGKINPTGAVSREIKGFQQDTPGWYEYINLVFQQLIDNDVTMAEETAKVIKDLRVNLMELKIQYETEKQAEVTGVNASLFTETFVNLDDVILGNGATKYDAVNMKIYLA